MKLIIGLGNPGRKYDKTKHNVGFMVIDELTRRYPEAKIQGAKFHSMYGTMQWQNETILFIEPTTFMNLSGESVKQWCNFYKLNPENIFVIHDDMDLPVGKIRIRKQGGHGGHNGLRNIIDHLKTNHFIRLKVGIGRPFPAQSVTQHVLSPFGKAQFPLIEDAIKEAAQACQDWIEGDTIEDVMTRYN
ncbi:aminoacyl-tRNA hydrolase [Allofustis seminis]|uniref:aminoacyl-tRNA hydrolase n=1 Tax=Allofustis seminis TaxID=166939 RepID=UPI00035F2972|nr:aminoacyl-tRNA hydrolase [Allofustis seminis]